MFAWKQYGRPISFLMANTQFAAIEAPNLIKMLIDRRDMKLDDEGNDIEVLSQLLSKTS